MPTVPPLRPQDQERREREKTTYKVLITGFGPFIASAPINPSSAVLPYLPSQLTVDTHDSSIEPGGATTVSIQTHPGIRVSYATVSSLIPVLYAAQQHEAFDFVIHIGMMTRSVLLPQSPLRNEYRLETRARSGKYMASDVDGKFPPPESVTGDGEEVEVLSPEGIDFSDLLLRWRQETLVDNHNVHGEVDLRLSNDAGLYLCEYIYYSSLHYFSRGRLKGRENSANADTKVVFLHVPPEALEDDLRRVKEVVVGLVKALVGSSLNRNHDVEDKEL